VINPPPIFCKALGPAGRAIPSDSKAVVLPKAGGLHPRFLGSPSMPPSLAETHRMPWGEFFPAGIPHPALSLPGKPSQKKLGVGAR
jgi:hypothetical protein